MLLNIYNNYILIKKAHNQTPMFNFIKFVGPSTSCHVNAPVERWVSYTFWSFTKPTASLILHVYAATIFSFTSKISFLGNSQFMCLTQSQRPQLFPYHPFIFMFALISLCYTLQANISISIKRHWTFFTVHVFKN